jgi:hypothetical protein
MASSPQKLLQRISNGFAELEFDITVVKQTASKRLIREGSSETSYIPLFLVTYFQTQKSDEIFKLNNLYHIIKVAAYRAQNGLIQCYSRQQLGHVSANCKQMSHCLKCGWSHLQKECQKKDTVWSLPNAAPAASKEGE